MNDLLVIETITPAIFSEPGGIDALISKLERDVRAVEIDVSTSSGRDACKSLAYKISRSKTALDQLGKDLVSDWKAKAKLVDDERKTIRDRLDALKAEVKQPVDDWEAAENDRIARHLNAITEIDDLLRFDNEPSSAAIAQRQAVLQTIIAERRNWQEFADQAEAAVRAASTRLIALHEGAVKREADAAELEALRAEKAERERKDREAEQARAAEQRAIAAAEVRKIDQEAAKERERIAAERAIEAERQRVAAEQAAERAAAEKRERNKKHRTKIIGEARAALGELLHDPMLTDAVITAIEAGEIPHIKIEF